MKPKRIWAMMGVVYMVIIFLLTTYWIATTTLIRGITGILLFPAAGALVKAEDQGDTQMSLL